MEGVFDRIGFLVEDSVDFEGSPEVVGFGPSPVEGWGLLSPQIGLIIDWSGYGSLRCDWLSGHGGSLCLWGWIYWDSGCDRG